MLYRLELVKDVRNEKIKVFGSSVPFAHIAVGDVINPSAWGAPDPRRLKVKEVEHYISDTDAENLTHTIVVTVDRIVTAEDYANLAKAFNR